MILLREVGALLNTMLVCCTFGFERSSAGVWHFLKITLTFFLCEDLHRLIIGTNYLWARHIGRHLLFGALKWWLLQDMKAVMRLLWVHHNPIFRIQEVQFWSFHLCTLKMLGCCNPDVGQTLDKPNQNYTFQVYINQRLGLCVFYQPMGLNNPTCFIMCRFSFKQLGGHLKIYTF